MTYFQKMRGNGTRPPRAGAKEIFLSWLGAAIAIAFIGLLDHALLDPLNANLLLASFGASAVLAFGAIRSPLAQPRNLVGGHVVSALVGVTCSNFLPGPLWLTASLAVATAIALMHMTETLHPPGGATALVAVIGGKQIHALGYTYVFFPCLVGSCIMLLLAVLFNNLTENRRYPLYWW